jgi:hypoxanthine phosphoribosyltransferase
MVAEEVEILVDELSIRRRVKELADEISRDYEDLKPLIVAVLRGSFVFVADLIRELEVDAKVDFITLENYEAGCNARGQTRVMADSTSHLSGEHVIVVEDIVDSGLTLHYLYKDFLAREPKSIEIVALLSKASSRRADVRVKYVGFEIPDRFVFGYGLDLQGKYRGLPFVACLKDDREA